MLEYVNQGTAQIRVFGVGGGGSNAVDCMINEASVGLDGITFICSNTDAQALQRSNAPIKIQLGIEITGGLGAGANPEIGEKSALADQGRIEEVLAGADMVFITAGMGGGTGTGAAPVVAQIAKSMGILTVAVVTKPLKIEGQHRMRSAERGIAELRKHVDSLIEIPNQRLLGQTEGLGLNQTFAFANRVLIDAVKGITEIITCSGVINVDFADVKAIMSNQGSPSALMGTGVGRGEKRALAAAAAAISSPLLNHDISGASSVLMNFTGGNSMSLDEIHEAASTITQKISGEPVVILGMVVNEDDFDEETMKVTVIATGFPEMDFDDHFDAPQIKSGSPYDRKQSRLPYNMNSNPPANSNEAIISREAAYKSNALSTNPPMLNSSSSSSSSDEHPRWTNEVPNMVQEAQEAPRNSDIAPQDHYAQSPSQPMRAYQHVNSSGPSYQRTNQISAPASTYSEPKTRAVSYPEKNYQESVRQPNSYEGRSRGGAPYNQEARPNAYEHAPAYPVNNAYAQNSQRQNPRAQHGSGGYQEAQQARSNSNLANSNQATPRASTQRSAHSNVDRSYRTNAQRRSYESRDRKPQFSSLTPVAPMGRSDDEWGARSARQSGSYQQVNLQENNTQDYDSIGTNPNNSGNHRK